MLETVPLVHGNLHALVPVLDIDGERMSSHMVTELARVLRVLSKLPLFKPLPNTAIREFTQPIVHKFFPSEIVLSVGPCVPSQLLSMI